MPFSPEQLAGLIAAISFAAGLNVYATVASLGLLARADVVSLPGNLHVVQTWPVIAIAAVLFVIEFFADKIPAFDLIWNALHTFVRVPVAALLAYALTLSNQTEWAKPLVKATEGNQISDLAQARLQLAEGQKAEAVKTLRIAIAKDAGSLVAERAKEMLKDLKSEYTPPIDPGLLTSFLSESFAPFARPTEDLVASGGTLPLQPSVTPRPTGVAPTAVTGAGSAGGAQFRVFNTEGQGLFLRQDHSGDSQVLKTLPDGTIVTVVGQDFSGPDRVWKNVREPDGSTGWVAADYLQTVQ